MLRDRLQDPVFCAEMVRFLRALRAGLRKAKSAPILAIKALTHDAPELDAERERLMLEVVGLLPDSERFGRTPRGCGACSGSVARRGYQ